ncbi:MULTISPECIES: 30S ribosomal protein S20 [unclassified Roseovarius]|uniref:30S ribosomal protein S20 n=1 Tax=unclassified Roseovarius TaxID=2614913 RepID=UPI00273D886A|nr:MULTISPECIES: 30S ribosomal protein S20 [unclassified Roseovarius]
MANSAQSKKRARQNEKRFAVNKARRSRIRTYIRKVEEAIASGDKDAATTALRAAQPELMRGVSKGVFHKNTAARKISRLSARVKAIG